MSTHARDLSFAIGAAVKVSRPARDHRQYGTGLNHRRDRAHRMLETDELAGAGLDVFEG